MDGDATHPGFDVGARLRALREKHGLSQRELAKRAGVSNAIISLIEQNRTSPSVGSLKKVLDGLPVSLAEFFAMELPAPPQVAGSPEHGYRMRARVHASNGLLGFYREGTHVLCGVAQTRQLADATNTWIAGVEELIARHSLTGLAAVDVSENISGGERACHIDLHGQVDASGYTVLAEGLTGLSATRADRAGVEVLSGTPCVVDVLSGLRLRRDVRSFFQGNRFLLELLVQRVTSLAGTGPVVDLYAGVGLFGLSLAAAGAPSVSDSVAGTLPPTGPWTSVLDTTVTTTRW